MKIQLLAFATARDALGATELAFEIEPGSSVADLAEILQRDYPRLAAIWPRVAVAVDGEIVEPETELWSDAEVALLPPVSGGSTESRAELVEDSIDLEALVEAVTDPSCGAVVLFIGTVRNRNRGQVVDHITYDAYRSMALDKMEAIVSDLEASSSDLRVRISHRLGAIPVGEASVVIAVASPHRQTAYEASRLTLERLKSEVPIWKLERYQDGRCEWREEEPLR